MLCGDKTEDGEETLHFPAVTPLPFAPSVVPDTSRAVPYPATATVTIHGVPNGTYAVEKSGPVTMRQVKEWVTKVKEHAKAAGDNSPVIKYVMPQSAIDATPQKVKDFLRLEMTIPIVPVAIP